VRSEGLEPPRPRGHQALDLARLPVPPRARRCALLLLPVDDSNVALRGSEPRVLPLHQPGPCRPDRQPRPARQLRRTVHASDGSLFAPHDSNVDGPGSRPGGLPLPKGRSSTWGSRSEPARLPVRQGRLGVQAVRYGQHCSRRRSGGQRIRTPTGLEAGPWFSRPARLPFPPALQIPCSGQPTNLERPAGIEPA
jgi:hypothetical protein